MRPNACVVTLAAAAMSLIGSSALPARAESTDWPSYNRTLTSNRFAPIAQINRRNVTGLQVLCSYDTHQVGSFQSGLIETGGALYATTEHDTISIDPNTCKENWRVHEEFPSSYLGVARGVAVLDGRVFRGGSDGNVRAYDAKSGKLLWTTPIANEKAGETVPAAPIAWNGMVFVGNAGGDNKGVKGRMYGLDAATGKIIWEFYLVPRSGSDIARGPAAPAAPTSQARSWKTAAGFEVTGGATWTSYTLDPATGLLYVPGGNPAPDFVKEYRDGDNLFTGSVVVLDAKTGAYRRHTQLVRHDFHDWDVASAPALFSLGDGRKMLAVAPKDGRLYGIDVARNVVRYRVPVTTVENEHAPLTSKGVRFCPGSLGGSEWNGPAYDPADGTVITGEVDWCATVHTDSEETLRGVSEGRAWSGASRDGFGTKDSTSRWAGWLTASDARTGARKWQFKAPAPIVSGVTPTAGGLVFVGDASGNLYAFNSSSGAKLWSQNLGAPIGGGVVTYDAGEGQRIAVSSGMISPIWPTEKTAGRIVVFGLK